MRSHAQQACPYPLPRNRAADRVSGTWSASSSLASSASSSSRSLCSSSNCSRAAMYRFDLICSTGTQNKRPVSRSHTRTRVPKIVGRYLSHPRWCRLRPLIAHVCPNLFLKRCSQLCLPCLMQLLHALRTLNRWLSGCTHRLRVHKPTPTCEHLCSRSTESNCLRTRSFRGFVPVLCAS